MGAVGVTGEDPGEAELPAPGEEPEDVEDPPAAPDAPPELPLCAMAVPARTRPARAAVRGRYRMASLPYRSGINVPTLPRFRS